MIIIDLHWRKFCFKTCAKFCAKIETKKTHYKRMKQRTPQTYVRCCCGYLRHHCDNDAVASVSLFSLFIVLYKHGSAHVALNDPAWKVSDP